VSNAGQPKTFIKEFRGSFCPEFCIKLFNLVISDFIALGYPTEIKYSIFNFRTFIKKRHETLFY